MGEGGGEGGMKEEKKVILTGDEIHVSGDDALVIAGVVVLPGLGR